MSSILLTTAVLAAGLTVFLIFYALLYKKVELGNAMIVNTLNSELDVTFTGRRLVIPVIHRKEIMSITIKTIELNCRGENALTCKDNIRADINIVFMVCVNNTIDDVLRVARAIGCKGASDQATIEKLFSGRFLEAVKTVAKRFNFIDIYMEAEQFRDETLRFIGEDLYGFVLEDIIIDYLEQAPVKNMEKDYDQNI